MVAFIAEGKCLECDELKSFIRLKNKYLIIQNASVVIDVDKKQERSRGVGFKSNIHHLQLIVCER